MDESYPNEPTLTATDRGRIPNLQGLRETAAVSWQAHLQGAVLWVQQAVRNKVLSIAHVSQCVSGAENAADLDAQPLGGAVPG